MVWSMRQEQRTYAVVVVLAVAVVAVGVPPIVVAGALDTPPFQARMPGMVGHTAVVAAVALADERE